LTAPASAEDADMELGILLAMVIVFAVVVAIISGLVAARVLTHAAETSAIRPGKGHDR
jgi:hypothetical protein